MKAYFVPVARDNVNAGENLRLSCRGSSRIFKAISNYSYKVEDLRTRRFDDVHSSIFRIYHDCSLDTTAIMSGVFFSGNSMFVKRLFGLTDSINKRKVQIRWKGLPKRKYSKKSFQNVYEYVPKLLKHLFNRKNTPTALEDKARRTFLFSKGEYNLKITEYCKYHVLTVSYSKQKYLRAPARERKGFRGTRLPSAGGSNL